MTSGTFEHHKPSILETKTFYLELVVHVYFWGFIGFFYNGMDGAAAGAAFGFVVSIALTKWWLVRAKKSIEKVIAAIDFSKDKDDEAVAHPISNIEFDNNSWLILIPFFAETYVLHKYSSSVVKKSPTEFFGSLDFLEPITAPVLTVFPFFNDYLNFLSQTAVTVAESHFVQAYAYTKVVLYVGVLTWMAKIIAQLYFSNRQFKSILKVSGSEVLIEACNKVAIKRRKGFNRLMMIIVTLLLFYWFVSPAPFQFSITGVEFQKIYPDASLSHGEHEFTTMMVGFFFATIIAISQKVSAIELEKAIKRWRGGLEDAEDLKDDLDQALGG